MSAMAKPIMFGADGEVPRGESGDGLEVAKTA